MALRPALLVLVALSASASAACSSSTSSGRPALPSSADQTAYAMGYKDELQTTSKNVADTQARAKELDAGFAKHVDELKKPDWTKVETIVTQSDAAGRSAGLAGAQDDAQVVKAFWSSEKNDINARVAGNVQHTAKEAGCSVDVGGAAAFAMNDAINKQLQKRLRSKNDAFVVIERYKTSLGPQNVAALEKLADEIAEASYTVNVLMPAQRSTLQRLADDKSDVAKTLDRFVQAETAFQGEPGRTDAEKKASADRVTAANKSKAELDATAAQARDQLKDLDKAIEAAKKEYADALAGVKAKIAERKKAEPPAKS